MHGLIAIRSGKEREIGLTTYYFFRELDIRTGCSQLAEVPRFDRKGFI